MVRVPAKTTFICRECGADSPRWAGRCPQCSSWNTLEEVSHKEATAPHRGQRIAVRAPRELSAVDASATPRIPLSSQEFNRVLGGGIVPGSLILIGGEPGIGKSTLLLQTAAALADEDNAVLYISGEESEQQLRLRAGRLGLEGKGLFVLAANELDSIINSMDRLSPRLVIIDSIQTVYLEDSPSSPGTAAQIRDSTWRLLEWSKATGVPVFISGHVTKDGSLAGPRLLEHMVDVVLYLEGEPHGTYRLVRGVKNRYGSTNEVGIFEMNDRGLKDVADPSKALLSERLPDAVGSAIVPTLEGTRPLVVEVQALTSLTPFNLPRRIANGVDLHRLLLVAAILSKRLGAGLANQDVIVNIVGGLRVSEPAVDLAIALAILSSLKDIPLTPDTAVIGELGLSGEVRSVNQMERRLREAAQMGFRRGIIPKSAPQDLNIPREMSLVRVGLLTEAVRAAMGNRRKGPRGVDQRQIPANLSASQGVRD